MKTLKNVHVKENENKNGEKMKVYTNELEKWKQEKNQQIIKITTVNKNIRATTRENLSSEACKQQRRRPACAYAQSDQRLCYSLIGK